MTMLSAMQEGYNWLRLTHIQAWKETPEVKAPYKELKQRWSTDEFGRVLVKELKSFPVALISL